LVGIRAGPGFEPLSVHHLFPLKKAHTWRFLAKIPFRRRAVYRHVQACSVPNRTRKRTQTGHRFDADRRRDGRAAGIMAMGRRGRHHRGSRSGPARRYRHEQAPAPPPGDRSMRLHCGPGAGGRAPASARHSLAARGVLILSRCPFHYFGNKLVAEAEVKVPPRGYRRLAIRPIQLSRRASHCSVHPRSRRPCSPGCPPR